MSKSAYSSNDGFHTGGDLVIPTGAKIKPNGTQAANIPQITTANGSDAGTTQTLANATKATLNLLLTACKNAGIVAAD